MRVNTLVLIDVTTANTKPSEYTNIYHQIGKKPTWESGTNV